MKTRFGVLATWRMPRAAWRRPGAKWLLALPTGAFCVLLPLASLGRGAAAEAIGAPAAPLEVSASLIETPAPMAPAKTALRVPIVRQSPERCGPAALEMVLRYYEAAPAALLETASAYDSVLRGSLITDLAAAARRAGYEATVSTLSADSLIALLAAGVPPIVLYQHGRAPLTVPHFGVVTGWDATRERFTLNEGRAHPRDLGREAFARRWRTAGSQALIIRRRAQP